MPAPVQDLLTESKTEAITFSIEPALNAVHSLFLMNMVEKRSGLSDWVVKVAEGMSAEERAHHRLVIIGFYFLVNPDRSWPSFPAFIEHLEKRDPMEMQETLLKIYAETGNWEAGEYDKQDVLASADNYVAFLTGRFGEDHVEVALEKKAYEYVRQPEKMQELIVSHLRKMWDEHLQDEWERVRPMLEDSVAAFQEAEVSGMSKEEAIKFVTQDELDDKSGEWLMRHTGRIIFVPSAHVGPYVGRYKSPDQLWIIFGARIPEGVDVDAPDLSRADIVVRLNALADDDRLRILKFISERGEQRSPQVMDALGFSQSSSSPQAIKCLWLFAGAAL